MPDVQGASAAPSHPLFATPQAQQPADAIPGLGSLVEVVIALLVVLAVIMAVAWIARRMRVSGAEGSAIRILAEATLGPKERAVLLQVMGRQMLVGVAAGSVTTLHVFDGSSPSEAPAGTSTARAGFDDGRPSFGSLLRRSLGLP